jgi:hypothetical protein
MDFYIIHKWLGPKTYKPVYKSEIQQSKAGAYEWNEISLLTSELANEEPENEIRIEFF